MKLLKVVKSIVNVGKKLNFLLKNFFVLLKLQIGRKMKDFVFSLKVSRHTEPGNNGCGGIGEMKIVSGIVQMLDGIDDEFARSVVSLDFVNLQFGGGPHKHCQ